MKTLRYLLLAFGSLFVASAVITFFASQGTTPLITSIPGFADPFVPTNFTLFTISCTAAAMCFIIRWGLLITKHAQKNESVTANHSYAPLIMFYVATAFSLLSIGLFSAHHWIPGYDIINLLKNFPVNGVVAWAYIFLVLAVISWITRWGTIINRRTKS